LGVIKMSSFWVIFYFVMCAYYLGYWEALMKQDGDDFSGFLINKILSFIGALFWPIIIIAEFYFKFKNTNEA